MRKDRRAAGEWRRSSLGLRILSALMVLTWVAGCGSETGDGAQRAAGSTTSAPPPSTTTTVPPYVSYVAEATVPSVQVFDAPDAPQPIHTLANPNQYGAPLVLLETKGTEPREGWVNVYLPVRPNGATGWIRASDVRIVATSFSLVVDLDAHLLTAWDGDQIVHEEPVAVGTNNTPTPTGLFYATALVQSDAQQQRKYGPYVYVLSGFSEVHLSFEGGQGEIGIHGTNNLGNLGQDVSNGCVRMSNDGITKLAGVLPLGVPVEIRP